MPSGSRTVRTWPRSSPHSSTRRAAVGTAAPVARTVRLYDCFLYTDQSPYAELLSLRLAYLADTVDEFVVVHSRETFAGTRNDTELPYDNEVVARHIDKVTFVDLDELAGETAREREAYARNKIRDGLRGLSGDDLVMVSTSTRSRDRRCSRECGATIGRVTRS
jgi:hypothetical protein